MRQKDYTKLYNYCHALNNQMRVWESPSENYAWHRMKTTLQELLEQELDCRRPLKVLDLGCGQGIDDIMLSLKLPKNSIEITGVDISREAIEIARKNAKASGLSNCKFVCANIESLELFEKFDVVYSSETLEHVIDTIGFIVTVTRHLKPNGVFIASTPNPANLPRGLFNAFAPDKFKENARFAQKWNYKRYGGRTKYPEVDVSELPTKEWLALFKAVGFEIETIRRGSLVYGGTWLDAHRLLFSSLVMADALLPKTAWQFSWNTVYKLRMPPAAFFSRTG